MRFVWKVGFYLESCVVMETRYRSEIFELELCCGGKIGVGCVGVPPSNARQSPGALVGYPHPLFSRVTILADNITT